MLGVIYEHFWEPRLLSHLKHLSIKQETMILIPMHMNLGYSVSLTIWDPKWKE